LPVLFRAFSQRAALLIDVNFGTFSGLIRVMLGELEYLIGRLAPFTAPHPENVQRLVFVCLGNINRSAFAAEVARINGARVISIGLSTSTGAPAFKKAISTAHFTVSISARTAPRISPTTPIKSAICCWRWKCAMRATCSGAEFRRTQSPCWGTGGLHAASISTTRTCYRTGISRLASCSSIPPHCA